MAALCIDVAVLMDTGRMDFGDLVLVDTRSIESWEQGHIPGALHLPTAEIADRAATLVPRGVTVVVRSGAVTRRSPDPLTAPATGASCAC